MRSFRFLPLLALAGLGGCDLFGPDFGPPAEIARSGLPSGLVVGQEVSGITVTVSDDEGRAVAGESVTWSPSHGSVDPAVSQTNDDGVATTRWTLGTTSGQQTLTATAGSVTITFSAQVGAGPLQSITLDPEEQTLSSVGDTLLITASGRDAYGNQAATPGLGWSSSAPAIASVTAGRVISHAEGSVRITAVSGPVSASADVIVDQVVVGLGISPGLPIMVIGETEQLVAVAVDARGSTVDTALTVEWASSDPGIAAVDAEGNVTAVAAGDATVSAIASPFAGEAPVDVRVGPRPAISSITPSLLAAGDTATVTGVGFSTDAALNQVTVAGVAATVLSAEDTQLRVELPGPGSFPCGPTGERDVVVDVDGLVGRSAHPVAGAARQSLGVGESRALFGSDVACNELTETGTYVLSVFNASPAFTSATSFQLRGTAPAAPSLAAHRVRPRIEVPSSLPAMEPDPEAEAHLHVLEESIRVVEELGLPPRDRPTAGPPLAAASVGDLYTFSIPDLDTSGNTCQEFIRVTARAVYSGEYGVIWEDTVAPLAGTMDAVWDQMGVEYDEVMHQILLDNFGDPLAYQASLDNDDRIAMLFSKRVNDFERGVAGFVWSGDFYTAVQCPASDEREIFYGRVPTSSAEGYESGSVALWRWSMRSTIIHEAKHLTAYATKFSLGAGLEETGLEESTARLSEELYSRALQGYGQFDNVGYDDSIWCERRVGSNFPECDLVPLIMGKHYSGINAYMKSPALLSPLGPAVARESSYYGSGWQFVRWTIDQSGQTEPEFIRSIVAEPELRGPANLTDKAGRTLAELLADYTLAFAVDDHPSGMVPARVELTMPGWNTRDMFAGLHEDYAGTSVADSYATPWPLATTALPAGDFQAVVEQIRGGGAAIFQLTGMSGAQLLELLSESGATAPSTLGLSIVRVQ